MNKIILLIFLLIIIILPNDVKLNTIMAKEDFSPYIGYSGCVNTQKFTEEAEQDKKECACGGTGFILSGDGIAKIKCPCEKCTCSNKSTTKCGCGCGKDDCKCQSSASCQLTSALEVSKKPHYYVLYFTADWCSYCQKFKIVDLPILKEAKWYYEDYNGEVSDKTIISFVDLDKYRDLFTKYDEEKKENIPLFIIMKDDEPLKKNGKIYIKYGYHDYKQFSKFFNDAVEEDKRG